MFNQNYYRSLIQQQIKLPTKQSQNEHLPQTNYPIKPEQKYPNHDEHKFFMLPPNKMVTLLKKNKSKTSQNENLKEFMHKHSLKQIVDFGETLPSISELKLHRQSLQLYSPRQAITSRPQITLKRKPIQISKLATEPSKKSITVPRTSLKLIRLPKQDTPEVELYNMLRKINYSPMHIDDNFTKLRSSPIIQITSEQKIQDPLIPKSVLPFPPRTKNQLRKFLLRALQKIRALGLTIKYVMENKIFSKKPYEKPFSQEFILAIKKNDYEKAKHLLKKNCYLVFDFDYYNMTGLHWACKKGYLNLVELLLNYKADVDAVDLLHRTPLILSIEENHLDITHLLLVKGAYIWSTALTDLHSVLEKNEKAKILLTRVRRLQIMAKWSHQKEYLNLI